MALGLDLAELSGHLRQERLFVTSEREQLQNLFEQLKLAAEQLYHQSWIGREQKDILDALIRSSKDVTPAECCSRTNVLESSSFVDGYKQLSYHDSKYGEFLKYLLDNPSLVGQILVFAEKNNVPYMSGTVKTLMHSVYGNCVLQEDEIRMLHMLKCLLELQLATGDNPRRMLRRGSCAFSIAFKQLFDVVFSAKLFLTAALHDPVMRLLMEDEWFYDIDPGKALVRFPPPERLRRFGEPGTDQYKEKLAKYRTTIVEKLVIMATRFINSIKNNMHCFPPSLGWLVSQVYQTLNKNGKLEMVEVRAVCADLVFALFICPAICDPEPHGITTDVPISHIARHNLMQMAQIIQMLAISQSDEIDPKLLDLYSRFEKGCMSSLLDSLLDGIGMELPSTTSTQLPCLARTSSLIQLSHLNNLVSFLREAMQFVEDGREKKCLEELLSGLTAVTPQTPVQNPFMLLGASTPTKTPPGTPNTLKKYKGKKKMSVVSMISQPSDDSVSISSLSMETETQPTNQVEEVLVITLGNDIECPGMMSEQKVLLYEQENKRRRVKYQMVHLPGGYEGGPVEIQEKRTRFSLSHDQESIGNTSDIPEAISEGASSHSVGSQDLENDDDNDNFSDMISANVSGRGTPNISGRDTPLSQAESVEQEPVPHQQPVLPETVQKKNREDVTDKFGKFEIKQELDYDLKSTVSDTWSTDVLASDSEPPEMNQQVRLEEIAEEMVRQHLLATQERVSEMSETASDAWSTDVLASDTDEKQGETFSEFDDMSSMAEMGSNLDEVRSESDINEGNEVTPLASGLHSPSESGSTDMFQGGAMGCMSGDRPDHMNSSPTFSDSVFTDMDVDRQTPERSRVETNLTGLDANRLFVPIKKKREPSPPGSSTDKIRDRNSSPNRLVNNYVLNQRPVSAPENYSGAVSRELQNLNLATNNLISPDSGARPKVQQQHNSNVNSNKDMKNKKNFSNLQLKRNESDLTDAIFRPEVKRGVSADSGVSSAQFLRSTDSGVCSTQFLQSTDSGVGSTQFLQSTDSGDIRLSEQQNTSVNEARFSAALSLFDPLSPGNDAASSDLLEGAGSPPPHAFQSYSKRSADQSANEPLISLKEEGDTSQFKFDITPTENKQNGMHVSTNLLGVNTQMSKRRGSTDSNRSSESGESKDGSGEGEKSDRSSLDNSTQQEKDLPNGDDGATPGKKRGLFKTFKDKIHKVVDVTSQTAAGIKKKGMKNDKEPTSEPRQAVDGGGSPMVDDKTKVASAEPNIIITETSDDILAKYRKKSILTSNPSSEPLAPTDKERRLTLKDSDDTTPLYDPNNVENCLAFLDAKRKLRMVLGSGDFQAGQGIFAHSGISYSPRDAESMNRENNDLVNLLRAQLSEAINLQNKDTIAQLHEALRCVRMFDNDGCKKLVRSLQEDYRTRSSYISYLVRCKQGLLNTLSHMNRLQNRIKREKEIYNKHMTSVCVRLFLESWEKYMMGFIQDFQKLTMSDEKTDLVERFLQFLYEKMGRDVIWQAANESQLDDARLAIERYIMSRIYTHAMFPNGDGDIHRDQLIQQHIKQLSGIISPDHKDLRIPKMYHLECPWPAAQREIYMINAYKTPKDKLRCVQRCSQTIMNLLSMANEKSVPAADDFMPVFIYVIIKANPPCMLSTIQYVNSFYENRLQGEEQYWWMQFSAAVEFIKTMDYQRESEA